MEHSNINIQLLNAVFFLAEMQGKEMCYNPNDGCIYQVKARSKADVTLLPLGGGEPTPIFDLNPDTLIFRDDLAERSANIGILMKNNGMETAPQQPTIQTEDCKTTAPKLTNISTTTAAAQNYIGVGKVDLPRFSSLYSGELFKVSIEVENLMDKIFAATNKQPTIEKTVENYHNAKKFAKNGQIYELKQLAARLQGRIAKQSAMQKGKDTMAAQQTARRKMWISAAIAVIIAVLYFGISNIEKRPYTQTETDIKTVAPSNFDNIIADFERRHRFTFFPYRKGIVVKELTAATATNYEEILQRNMTAQIQATQTK